MRKGEKKAGKQKLKGRYVFCTVTVLILIIIYSIVICCIGRYYKLNIILNGTTDINTVKVECSSDSIVRVKSISEGNVTGVINTLDIELESTGFGDVDVNVIYDDIYDSDYDDNGQMKSEHIVQHKNCENSFHVTISGLIYNRSMDNYSGMWTIQLFAAVLMIILIITFSISFYEKAKNGDFTYSTVALGGMIFFMLVTIILSVNDILVSHDYNNFLGLWNILYSLSNVSLVFAFATSIPLILFCLLVSISNIILVRREGFHPLNLLGVILGLSVIGGIVALYFVTNDIYSYPEIEREIMNVVSPIISFCFCYLECLLVSTIFCGVASVRYIIKTPMDYIIILGCAIMSDGTPTPILRSRIDRAVSFEKEQYEKWDKHAKFVPSGGQGSDEVVSEAECMKRYLMDQGIPEERILKEDKSVNTYQNMAFSKKVIEADSGDLSKAQIAFSTTNYHVFRGYTLAEKLGIKVKGISAKTKLYFFPNAFLREFIGLLFEQKKRHLFFMISGVLFFTGLYYVLNY